jgi:hypothetical protein
MGEEDKTEHEGSILLLFCDKGLARLHFSTIGLSTFSFQFCVGFLAHQAGLL